MYGMEGKVALVTGGSSGLGLAAAQRFAREGAEVIIAARGREAGEAAAAALRETGARAQFVACDVSRKDQVRDLMQAAVQTFGRLDYAFNSAGVGEDRDPAIETYPDELADEQLSVHVNGLYYCLKEEIVQMTAQGGGGAIVNMSSVYGIGADALPPTWYVAAKHAAIGMTRSAAMLCAPRGIRVNAVAPGVIETPLIASVMGVMGDMLNAQVPLGRVGRTEEVANAVVWLCSDEAAYIHGAVLPVDGGRTART